MNDPFIEEEAAERAPINNLALADEAAAAFEFPMPANQESLLRRLEQAVRELVRERDEGQDLLEGQCALNKLLVTQFDEARADYADKSQACTEWREAAELREKERDEARAQLSAAEGEVERLKYFEVVHQVMTDPATVSTCELLAPTDTYAHEMDVLREQRDALILQRAETVQELLQLKQLVDELSR